ncbi:hypothetical protein V6N12_021031 [Hibiscus sabdariffa]|uniref:RNase H type-1 domain-containing protein n=1 Tax=Hibiscus sabdariffa TaxID=183260 RepID=A0ABR2B2P6_9ROSI
MIRQPLLKRHVVEYYMMSPRILESCSQALQPLLKQTSQNLCRLDRGMSVTWIPHSCNSVANALAKPCIG